MAQYCTQDFANFLQQFFTDISVLRTSIKSTVYKILQIKIQASTLKQQKIKSDAPSILLESKKIFQDLKRIDTLLKGYYKSKIKQKTQPINKVKDKTKKAHLLKDNCNNITFCTEEKNKIFSVHNFKAHLTDRRKEKQINKFSLNSTPFNNKNTKQDKNRKNEILNEQQDNDDLILSQLQVEIDFFPQKINGSTQVLSEKTYIQLAKEKYRIKNQKNSLQEDQMRSKRVNTMYEAFDHYDHKILMKNEKAISEVIERNSECLNIIKSLRGQLFGKHKK